MRKSLQVFASLCFIICFTLSSCDVSKQYVRDGDRQYASGNFDEAATYYYNSLLLKPGNTNAKTGLKKAGDQVLSTKFSAFAKDVKENNSAEAVRQYRSCEKYYNNVKKVGVELEWTRMYDEVYEDIKNEYIQKLFNEGLELVQQKKYEKAEAVFAKIAGVDSSYKDMSVLRMNTVLEPLYQQGLKMMNEKKYKEAFLVFEKIMVYDPAFKDVYQLKEKAFQKACITLAVLPAINKTSDSTETLKIYGYITESLSKSENAFLKIIDTSSSDLLMAGIKKDTKGNVDPIAAAKAGKDAGIKMILLISLIESETTEKAPVEEPHVAYEAYKENIQNPSTGTYQFVTRFKKVSYADSYQFRNVHYAVFYQLIATDNAEIVTSDKVTIDKKDEQHIYSYKGNPQNLYPELPAGNFIPPAPTEWRDHFAEVKRQLMSKEELSYLANIEFAQKISSDIQVYIEK